MKPESIMKGYRALTVHYMGDTCPNGQSKSTFSADHDSIGNGDHENQPPKLVRKRNGTSLVVSHIHNKMGAEFLAKSCGSVTRIAVQENGRTYQRQGIDSYILPCDEMEQDRLDFMHALFKTALCSTTLIHVSHTPNSRFLDLGCGTGIWAIEMAKVYPNAYVLGFDISAIQPDLCPPNCVFKAPFDYELPWLIGEGQWDVIHMRMGCSSVTNWPGLYRKIFDHLRCGGWFEQVEVNFEPQRNYRPSENGSLWFWYQSLKTATERSKRVIALPPEQALGWLREAGFIDVGYEEVVLPLTPDIQPVYGRTAARWYRTAFAESVRPLCMAPFARVYGWTLEKIQSGMDAALTEALEQNMDVSYTLHLYKARKP